MANTFKNKVIADIGTVADGYTVPANTTTTVIGMTVANNTVSNIEIDVVVVDTSAGVSAYIIKDAIVPTGGNIVIIGGDQKVVLETGDELNILSNINNSADVVISMMETT